MGNDKVGGRGQKRLGISCYGRLRQNSSGGQRKSRNNGQVILKGAQLR